ncbi:MAG: Co2+/Mg2+ efflux protein ApaG [Candidatus Cyclonatronum sp.]|uniref:Co2+/Mg2+ efflux protein ApaG n=1 Tax=Cyclonatronum sp. TaxID=3024185 RepID=UPI0025BC6917|nr:Co2+/Mg2+ efflux protein ApaG [Cyclonatronum sp.]MCH8486052.1 Co2+/Mg2+ efflux protein ApaG [Cyclonatronum sp.]
MTYTEISFDIKVIVKPVFLENESDVITGKYVYAYFITIENLGQEPVKLLNRYWHIADSTGDVYEIEGEGVIGRQPVIGPGKSHSYNSYCVLKSMAGNMKGYYLMQRDNGERVKVNIPEFHLRSHLLN